MLIHLWGKGDADVRSFDPWNEGWPSASGSTMTAGDWIVLAGGGAAIAWVNWYFFVAQHGTTTAVVSASGAQEVTVTVKGGYEPATIHVHHGAPVRLVFDRQENSSCSEEVVLGDFGIRRRLPAFRKTAVEFTPAKPGTYAFSCGMSMMHGKLVVE
jgi:plastocyanin domain-containing protein